VQGIPPLVGIVVIVVVAVLVAWMVVVVRRTGGGNGAAGRVVVRCRDGHVFTTIWVPLASFKAIRLGPLRFQYCPVGGHWTFVVPVPPSELTSLERRMAQRYDDGPVP
jgi:hypothetical protein